MPKVTELKAASILTPQKVGSLASGYDFSLNPYAGCAFGCSYCYVPKFPNARHEFNEWGDWVEVKVNAPELLQKERTRIFGSRIFFSSATDPYQYLELKYRLSRRCLETLLTYEPAKVTMHTRSHLILQDIDLLRQFGSRLSVGVSLTTDNDHIREEFEPHAPSIGRRLQLIAKLSKAGINTYVSMSPLLPCDPDRLVDMVSPYVDKVWIDTMRWTEVNTHPELLLKYRDFFETDNYEYTVDYIASQFKKNLRSQPASAPLELITSEDVLEELVPEPTTGGLEREPQTVLTLAVTEEIVAVNGAPASEKITEVELLNIELPMDSDLADENYVPNADFVATFMNGTVAEDAISAELFPPEKTNEPVELPVQPRKKSAAARTNKSSRGGSSADSDGNVQLKLF